MIMGLDESVGGLSSLIAVFLPLSTAAFVLRLFARYRQKNTIGLDDYMIIPAWLCFVGICVAAIYGMANQIIAFPSPSNKVALANLTMLAYKVYWAADMLSVIGVGSIRLSALFFYRRVFVTNKQRWDAFGIITMSGIVIVISWIFGFVLFQIFACGSHTEWLFNIAMSPKCYIIPYLKGFAYSSFILDILVLIIPIPKIWSLHMDTSRKIAVSIVFLLAATGTAASLARLIINAKTLSSKAAPGSDLFLINTQLYYYLTLEAGFCLVAVNLPSLRYFILGLTPESALRSLRSFMSMSSSRFSSKNSERSASTAPPSVNMEESRSTRRYEHEAGSSRS